MHERFWSRVDRQADDLCWPWTGPLYEGYGTATLNGKGMKAHRASAIIHGLPVAPGLHVDHICRNRACVNPAHLRVVSARVNTLENAEGPTAKNAAKTHCNRGHLLAGDNLERVAWEKHGWRSCIACKLHRRRNYTQPSRRKPLATDPHQHGGKGA